MKRNFSVTPVCRRLVIVILSLWMLPGLGWGEEKGIWKTQEIAGEDYIGVDQIQKFYRFEKSTRNELAITLQSAKILVNLKIGSPDCLMNGIKIIFAKPVVELENQAYVSRADLSGLLDPMLRPNFIKGAGDFESVILDPARGGKEPGIANEFGTEAGFTLRIAELTKTMLEAKGFKAVLTRDKDQDLSLQERLDLANAVKENAVFIGISFNSGPQDAHGIQTSPVVRGEEIIGSDSFGHASVALSTAVHGSLIRRLGKNTADGGIKRGQPDGFAGITHPAIFIEAGYMTHPYEARLIANEAYQSAIATGIVDGLGKYRHAVSSKPPVKPEGVPAPGR